MHHTPRPRRTQRGNILFLILLAVVLFAALNYAVTSSMRDGGKDMGTEKAELLAAQFIQNAGLIEQAIIREQLVNGSPDWGFTLSIPGVGAPNGACARQSCMLFTERGGSIPFPRLEASATSDGVAQNCFINVAQIIDVGTSANDVAIVCNYVKEEVCEAFNRNLGLNNVDMNTADSIGGSNNNYNVGTLTSLPASTGVIGDTNTSARQKAVCYPGLASPFFYRIHYVIMER